MNKQLKEVREQIAKIHCESCLYRLQCENECGTDFETRNMKCRKPYDVADAILSLDAIQIKDKDQSIHEPLGYFIDSQNTKHYLYNQSRAELHKDDFPHTNPTCTL